MKLSWIVLFAFIASLAVANAQELDIKTIAVRNTVLPGQDAEFLLGLKYELNAYVSLSYSDDYWRARIEPSTLTLVSGESYDNVKINLYPLSSAKPGNYIFNLRVVSLPDYTIIKEHPITVTLADKDNAVAVDVLTSALEPGLDENLLQLKFENNYNIAIKGLKVSIESKLFNYETSIDLEPRASKVEDIVVRLDKTIPEGSYDVNIKLAINNIELTTVKKTINVGKIADLKRNIGFAGGLFTNIKEVSFINEGNSVVRETYTESLGMLEDFFTATKPEPDYVQQAGEGRQLGWNIELGPGESRTIAVTTGYRGFVILVILLLVLMGIWWVVFGKEIIITKKVVSTSHEHDAFGSIKVNLYVKNRSKHRMYNVRILDRIASYLQPVKEEFSGMHPLSVKKTVGGGAVMIWNISAIEANGEHVISYRIKTKLPVFGKVMLPTAVARYRNMRGRIVNSYSNKMILFSLPGHE